MSDLNDERYRLLATALARGEGASLVDEARALVAEEQTERATVALAICLVRAQKLDDAEKTLAAYAKKRGDTAAVLVNLGKIAAERGHAAVAEKFAARALDKDPNYEGALLWWASLVRKRSDDVAFVNALATHAKKKGSWRVHLVHYGHRLEKNDAKAIESLRAAIAVKPDDAALAIAQSLLRAGEARVLVDVLADYAPEKHGTAAGAALVDAWLALDDVARADAIVAMMRARLANAKTTTKKGADDVARADKAIATKRAMPTAATQTEVVGACVVMPLSGVVRRLPKPGSSERVAVAAFVDDGAARGDEPRSALCRALALSLADALRGAGVSSFAIVPVVKSYGYVSAGHRFTVDELLALVSPSLVPRWLVTGALDAGGHGARIEVHDLRARRVLVALADAGAQASGAPAEIVRALASTTMRALGIASAPVESGVAVVVGERALAPFLVNSGHLDRARDGVNAAHALADVLAEAGRADATRALRELAVAAFQQARAAKINDVEALASAARAIEALLT